MDLSFLQGRFRIVIYIALIVAVGVRFYRLASQSLWLDELWAVEIACGHDADHQLLPVNQVLNHPPDLTGLASAVPAWKIWNRMDRVTGPPGYHLLLRGWMTVFGQSEASLRSMSAIVSVIALAVFYRVIRVSIGPEPAVWAALIATIAGPQIHYAQDARPYALMLLETAVAFLSLVKISTGRPTAPRCVVLIISSLLLLLTHYFTIAVVLAIGLHGMFCTTGWNRRTILLCMLITGMIFAAVWGPCMWRQLPRFSTDDRAAAFLQEGGSNHLRLTLWRVLTMPLSLICDVRPIPRWYAIGGLWYLLAALLFRTPAHRLSILLYLCVIASLTVLDLAHSTAHLAYIRYALVASFAVYGVIAASIFIHPWIGRTLCVSTLVFCLFSLPRAYAQTNEDFRGLGITMLAWVHDGDLIVFAGPAETYAPQILYLASTYYAGPLHGPVLLTQSPATTQMMDQLKSRNTIWLAADPAVRSAREWLPGFHIAGGQSWPEVGSLLKMERDP